MALTKTTNKTIESQNDCSIVSNSENNKKGTKRKSIDKDKEEKDEMIVNEPALKKQRLSNNISSPQQHENPINPLIIRLSAMKDPMNERNEISENRKHQKKIIGNMKCLDDVKVRKLLLHIIENSDESVQLLQEKLPLNASEPLHCILCHTQYHEEYNGDRSCVLQPDSIDGECERGQCPCGGWDCCNSRCPICYEAFCEGDGDDHCCRIGPHISDKNSSEIRDFTVLSCDEDCEGYEENEEDDDDDDDYY